MIYKFQNNVKNKFLSKKIEKRSIKKMSKFK